MNKDKFNVLIVGLGAIGLQYDIQLSADEFILSHARAFSVHQDFNLVGGVDSSPINRGMFEKKYQCASYRCIDDAKHLRVDIAVIATPTNTHCEITKEIMTTFNPKAILCEKPLAYCAKEAYSILNYCSQKGCLLFVNYIRRSDVSSSTIQSMIRSGAIRTPLKGVCWYTKGLYNSGSHFINLLELWLGQVTELRFLGLERVKSTEDLEIDIMIRFGSSEVMFLSTSEEDFSNYTIELMSPSGRLFYGRGGHEIRWQQCIKDPILHNYLKLEDEGIAIENGLNKIQASVVDQLAYELRGIATQLCSGKAAVQTNNVLERIRDGI